MTYRFQYDPTVKEIRSGMAQVSRSIYVGKWRFAALCAQFIRGASYAMLGMIMSDMIFHWSGYDVSDAPSLGILIGVAIGLAAIGLNHMLALRCAAVNVGSLMMDEQAVELSQRGISLQSKLTQSKMDWRAIEHLREQKDFVVLCFGGSGLTLPNRVLAKAGPPEEIRAQIKIWYHEAHAA